MIIHTKAGILDVYGKMDELEPHYNANTIKVANGDKLILAQKKYNDFIKRYMMYAKNGGIVNV